MLDRVARVRELLAPAVSYLDGQSSSAAAHGGVGQREPERYPVPPSASSSLTRFPFLPGQAALSH